MTADPITSWLQRFEHALAANDQVAISSLFADICYWRDMVAFTWNIHTCEGCDAITAMLQTQLPHIGPHTFAISGTPKDNAEGWTEAWFTFETASGLGKGHLRLRNGRAYTLLTTLSELKDHAPATRRNRVRGQTHGMARGKLNWTEQSDARRATLGHTEDPDCVIIGGGQGGMALAARLKHLGITAIVLEKNARAGDSWRNRYPSLCLHDPVWYDHMPFIPFPEDWPVFTPKDRMGDWLEMYAAVMDLNYWTSTVCKRASFDEASARWTIEMERDGKPHTLRAAHLVFATGMSGYPNVPAFKGQDTFTGVQMHSSAYAGGKAFAGQRCVVIGSNTSAHDIAADLWEHSADVTMVQRSGTLVLSTETVLDVHLAPLYSEDALARGIDTETADYIATTWPHRLVEERQKATCATMRERDRDLHTALEKVGFILDFGPDNTGLALKSIREGGGFYINVGASDLLCDGSIKLKSGTSIEAMTENAVVLSDGTRLPADVVIYATGYRSMNEFVADIVGRDVADQVGRCWGVGSGTRKDPAPWLGELRNMWKPTSHPALWFQGGNLAQSRHFSRFLALQIKARKEGVPTPVYGLA